MLELSKKCLALFQRFLNNKTKKNVFTLVYRNFYYFDNDFGRVLDTTFNTFYFFTTILEASIIAGHLHSTSYKK